MAGIMPWVLATRPWSFPLSVMPLLYGNLLARIAYPQTFSFVHFIGTFLVGMSAHAAANVVNSYYDYLYGFDKKETAEDRTLVSGSLTPRQSLCLGTGLLVVTLAGTGYYIFCTLSVGLLVLSLPGLYFILAYSVKTGNCGKALKHMACGEIVMFLCFGPVLCGAPYIVQTHHFLPLNGLLVSFPNGLITAAVLLSNNTRDVDNDREQGASTLATLCGREGAFLLYRVFLLGTCLFCLLLAWLSHSLVFALPLLSAYFMYYLLIDFKTGNFNADGAPGGLPGKTAQCGLVMGALLLVALWWDGKKLM